MKTLIDIIRRFWIRLSAIQANPRDNLRAKRDDPFSDPVVQKMTPHELADLPFGRRNVAWPAGSE